MAIAPTSAIRGGYTYVGVSIGRSGMNLDGAPRITPEIETIYVGCAAAVCRCRRYGAQLQRRPGSLHGRENEKPS